MRNKILKRLKKMRKMRRPLRILVIGQVSAGKSSLINAVIFGEVKSAVSFLPDHKRDYALFT
jgi:predicted GTPase